MKPHFIFLPAALWLSACGGGGSGNPTASSPTGDSPPPSSPGPAADTVAPIVSASVNVSSDIVTFVATATDNVGVSSVTFVLDDGALQGSVSQSPSDGTYSLQTPINIIGVGNHTLSARASDAAGNSAVSAVVTFTIGGQPTGPDTTPPAVTGAVDGNFGLVKLTAVAMDDRNVDTVRFSIDGTALAISASPELANPANRYYNTFDTSSLVDGSHTLVARASDGSNQTDSAEVTFNVDSTAGLIETGPNETIVAATPVMRPLTQVAGTLKTTTTTIGGTTVLQPDRDFYWITLAAGETLIVDMLSAEPPQSLFLSVVDASGAKVSGDSSVPASNVTNVSYTNGPMTQDVYISVTSIPMELKRDRYKLSLTYR